MPEQGNTASVARPFQGRDRGPERPAPLVGLLVVLCLLPLAAQNIGLYSPMSWVIIGGLISSTLLVRLVTLVMYKLLPLAIEVATPEVRGSGEVVPA